VSAADDRGLQAPVAVIGYHGLQDAEVIRHKKKHGGHDDLGYSNKYVKNPEIKRNRETLQKVDRYDETNRMIKS